MLSSNTIIIAYLGFLVGVVVGAITVLFLTPMSGADMRTRVREEAKTDWGRTMTGIRAETDKTRRALGEMRSHRKREQPQVEGEMP